MSVDGAFERAAILSRAQTYLVGGRVYTSIPDEAQLARSAAGTVKPYIVIRSGVIYALPDDRTIMGEEDQPHVMPVTVECWAATEDAAKAVAGAVRTQFIGWQPSPGSETMTAPGGSSFRDRDGAGTPTRYLEVVALETVINVGSNDGLTPTPGDSTAPGVPTVSLEALIDEQIRLALLAYTPTPVDGEPGPAEVHYFPNPVGQWSVVHALGRIPSVATYSLDGTRLLTDEVVTSTTVLATWASPTAGYAVLT